MKFEDLLTEKYSRNKPVVCVDVQPTYTPFYESGKKDYVLKVANFLAAQKGPLLMYVNADETGMTDDNVEHDIIPFWENAFEHLGTDLYESGAFDRMEWFDKGYGYLRGWMDYSVDPRVIQYVIREMYQQKVNSSDQLFDGDHDQLIEFIKQVCGGGGRIHKHVPVMSVLRSDPIHVGWVAMNQLRRYNNGYLIGGARNQCLKEIAILMNAFNINYTTVNDLIYG